MSSQEAGHVPSLEVTPRAAVGNVMSIITLKREYKYARLNNNNILLSFNIST